MKQGITEGGAQQDVQFCNSLLHRVNTTWNICPKVMHKLYKFTSETEKDYAGHYIREGDDQPLFWHLQDWHQDKWRHLDCTALVLFLLGLQQSPWSNRRTNILLKNKNLGHFSFSTQNKQSRTESLFLFWQPKWGAQWWNDKSGGRR